MKRKPDKQSSGMAGTRTTPLEPLTTGQGTEFQVSQVRANGIQSLGSCFTPLERNPNIRKSLLVTASEPPVYLAR
jgi:hypothetical protein